eukprot:CAMPEP_0175949560 /NCGR_PEP_ID=MMETSP0108-20121206/29101_1 /TAXON_ID=195067 ORGANISM="Goniomonas pacifica, Strain CCMP1869" /NCGR_SAMPLE_ID=MMETSP0108 /ASSEMBLY_ACC=CAM_ASM_000204 /LENGTH=122 /DNA_ID=CAMNT_0017275499 /DNA_START=266 /DNA_END=635 /DNA_ORIENTATION=+
MSCSTGMAAGFFAAGRWSPPPGSFCRPPGGLAAVILGVDLGVVFAGGSESEEDEEDEESWRAFFGGGGRGGGGDGGGALDGVRRGGSPPPAHACVPRRGDDVCVPPDRAHACAYGAYDGDHQ